MEDISVTRIMPNSLEAEQSVIGSMIMDRQAIITAGEMLVCDDFYNKQYGIMFQSMVEMCNEGKTVDIVTLQEKLKLNRVASVGIIGAAGCLAALVIQGIVSGWMDAVSIYICPLGAMLAAIMFFWVADNKFALDVVNKGTSKPVGKWFILLGKYVLVPLAFVALVAGAILGGIG